jgi:RHH-type proline utilization regulon transcriptional repressor/proline dehydrogenase/delta 1-pyrroline-5-carboxylate dehydrogenase
MACESNRLVSVARRPLLCLGPAAATALAQAEEVRRLGGEAVEAPGLPPEALTSMTGFSGALYWGPSDLARPFAQALARRSGPILPLITDQPDLAHARLERHICIDTTASGGNAQLLAQAAQA